MFTHHPYIQGGVLVGVGSPWPKKLGEIWPLSTGNREIFVAIFEKK
jgi:hypothetical protein